MSARRLTALILVAPLALAVASPGALAQSELQTPALKMPKETAGKPAVKRTTASASASKAERRPGELEGGFNSGVTAPLVVKKTRPADVVSEKRLPDGGLPLPNERSERGFGESPMGFDKNGNIGGMFKF